MVRLTDRPDMTLDVYRERKTTIQQQREYTLEYFDDTSQLCRTGHDDVSHTRMTTLAFILSELFPLDGVRCNFVSAP